MNGMKEQIAFLSKNIKVGESVTDFELNGFTYIAEGVWDIRVYLDKNYEVDEYGNKYTIRSVREEESTWVGSLTEYKDGIQKRRIKELKLFF